MAYPERIIIYRLKRRFIEKVLILCPYGLNRGLRKSINRFLNYINCCSQRKRQSSGITGNKSITGKRSIARIIALRKPVGISIALASAAGSWFRRRGYGG